MSDCSTHSFEVVPIRGQIVWEGEDQRPAPLSYARYVNGEERKVDHIELDGILFLPRGPFVEIPKENIAKFERLDDGSWLIDGEKYVREIVNE